MTESVHKILTHGSIFMFVGVFFIFISGIISYFQKQKEFEKYFKTSTFTIIGFTIIAISSIILGIDILYTGEFVYKGGRLATGKEAYMIGIFNILMFPVLFLFIFIKRFYSKKNDNK